jgi:hypothetical protein
MKKLLALLGIVILGSTIVAYSASHDEYQERASLFNVERFVIAGSVNNREPVGIVNAFSSSTEKVYCFLEARDISVDTTAHVVWYHGEKEMARVALLIRQGERWRTYSSKQLRGLTGEWKVELQDAYDTVIETVTFTVE